MSSVIFALSDMIAEGNIKNRQGPEMHKAERAAAGSA
jgi:hypothetical protein